MTLEGAPLGMLAVCRVGADKELECVSTGGVHLRVDNDAWLRLAHLTQRVNAR
jgi:hypothetical protein